MAITDYYTSLSYIPQVQSSGSVYTAQADGTPVSFQGAINQNSSKERAMAQQLGFDTDYKLFYPTSVTIPGTAIISDGTNRYKIVGEPKNTMSRNHHYRLYLKKTSAENLT